MCNYSCGHDNDKKEYIPNKESSIHSHLYSANPHNMKRTTTDILCCPGDNYIHGIMSDVIGNNTVYSTAQQGHTKIPT